MRVAPTEIVFVRVLMPLIAGICYGYAFAGTTHLYLFIAFSLLFIILLFGINSYYKKLRAYRFKYLIGILLFIMVFCFGGTLSLLEKENLKSNYFEKYNPNQLKVWIADEPQLANGILRFTANVTTVYQKQTPRPVVGKLLVAIKMDSLNTSSYTYGDELIIKANLTPVSPPYNPGEFDFKSWLASKNTYLQTFTTQNKVIQTKLNKGSIIIKYAIALRQKQVETYKKIIKNEEAFAVASTLILGYRADLSSETLSSYSKTGTIHALSVSGMHVGIIYVVLNWLLGFMNQKKKLRVLKILMICALIWFYSLLTGLSPSVLRSAIMLTIYILAKSFNKHTNSYNILAFTAFCLLLYNPLLIFDVGFQLSFLAVFGLVYIHPKIYKWFFFKPSWADWIWSSISLGLAAQIATFPLSIYYFHQFPMYFIFSNLFILIPITLLMYLGISILLFKIFFLAPIFEWLIIFMNDGLRWIANLPFSGVNQIWIDKFELIFLSTALLFGLMGLAIYKKQYLFISLGFLLVFQCLNTKKVVDLKNQKKVIFFSLGKGYCAAFIKANKAILVSDLNPKGKTFQFYIQPALDQHRIQSTLRVTWETIAKYPYFTKTNHQINFYGYRILLFDTSLNGVIINRKPTFNLLWIHKNPKHPLHELKKSVIFKSIIIDATNYTNNQIHYVAEANKFKIRSHILKKNKAYLIDLNNLPK